MYICPRCRYETKEKNAMRRHLYNMKKPCRALHHNVELTDDIKQSILDNSQWCPIKNGMTLLPVCNEVIVDRISASKRQQVWNTYIGPSNGQSPCFCCRSNIIDPFTFHCGHIVARANGGRNDIINLRPICSICNLSMGKVNMRAFAKQQFNIDVY